MKKLRKKLSLIVIVMLCASLLSNNIIYATGVVDVPQAEDSAEANYTVKFALLNQWDTGYQAEITIFNSGTEEIIDWGIEFDLEQNITDMWNAVVQEQNEHHYRIQNAGWNQNIPAGESVTFGFVAEGAFTQIPGDYNLQYRKEINNESSNIYIGEGYEVEFNIIDKWDTSYNAELTITNTSEMAINNWLLEFELKEEISDIWNAQVLERDGTSYLIKHLNWNADIPVGGSCSFGFTVDGSFTNFPNLYILTMQKVTASEEQYEVKYEIISSWDGGFTGNIIIANKTDEMIEDWALEFDYVNEIQDVWNGVIVEHTDSHYILNNAGYNSNIPSYGSIDVGFNVYTDDIESVIENITLRKYVVERTSETDKMFFDDKDSDGLPDYYEQHVTYTSPDTPISDGINKDGDRDEDGDGLTNLEEFESITNAYQVDTDYDGLTDYEEVRVYLTSPSDYDTDCDGVGDWTEIQRGTDPLNADSNFDGIKDGDEVITYGLCDNQYVLLKPEKMGYDVEIVITGRGDYNNKLNLYDASNDTTFPDIQYLVGAPLFIEHEDIEFDSAKIIFTLTNDIVSENAIENLQIASYNENTHQIEFLETVIDKDNNQLICNTEHFSYYFIIDKMKLFHYYLSRNIDTDAILCDVVFVIDSTGSMSYLINNTKQSIIKAATLTEELELDVNYGLVDYKDVIEDNYNSLFWGWYTEEADFKTAIGMINVSGGGNDPESVVDALETARLSGYRDSAMKSIVLVTDAIYREETNYSGLNSMDTEIERLVQDGIKVSIIAPTNLEETYRALAETTGGKVFGINTDYAESLVEIYTSISEEAQNYTWVRLSDGTVVKLLVDPETASEDDPTDTDGDGIADMEELTEKTELVYGGETYYVWQYDSNPAIPPEKNIITDTQMNTQDAITIYEMYEGIKKMEANCITTFYENIYTRDDLKEIPIELYQYLSNNVILYFLQEEKYFNWMWGALTEMSPLGVLYDSGEIFEKILVSPHLTALQTEIILDLKEQVLSDLKGNSEFQSYREIILIDPITGENLYMTHFAAACNAHYVQDKDIFIYPIEMSGWGGDLQTLAAEVRVYSPSTVDKIEIEQTIKSLLGRESYFSLDDLLCDVDAINCAQILLEDYYFSEAFQEYYLETEVAKRFSLFLDYYNGDLHSKMDELLPAYYFHDGTITAEERKLHSVTQLKFLKSTLDELTSDTSLWPSKEQIEVLKEYFQTYIVEQSLKE